MAVDIGAGAVAGTAAAPFVGTAGGAILGAIKGARRLKKLHDTYESARKAAKVAQALKPSATSVGAVPTTTMLESMAEGQRAADEYVAEAKRNGTYIDDQTESEAENLRNRVIRDNAAVIGGSNAVEYGLAFGGSKNPLKWANRLKRLAGASALEGGQEMVQENIPRYERGQELSWTDPQTLAAGIVGGLTGGGFNAAGQYIESRKKQNENPSNRNVFGVENYDMPTQSDRISEQVSKLKDGWQEIIPQIGGALKDNFGINATISSAARTAEHNAEVVGVPTSHHIIRENGGDALDVVFDRNTTAEERQKIIDYFKGTGKFKEVIWHNVGSGYHLHLGGLTNGQSDNKFNRGVYQGSDPNFNEKENRIWKMAQKASDYLYGKTGFNINPEMFYRQWIHETGNLSSELVEKDHNYGGLTYAKIPTKEELLEYDPNLKNDADFMARGMEVFNQPENGGKGKYRHYKSDEDYYKSYIDDFIIPRINRGELTSENVKSLEDYVTAMSNSGYFTGSPESYYLGMKGVKIPSTRGYSENIGETQNDESEEKTSETPFFDLNAEDETTKKLYEEFAFYKRDLSEGENAADNFSFFDKFMNDKDEFQNTKENRKEIADEYGEELANFALSRLPRGNIQNTQTPPKNQSSQKSEGVKEQQKIEIETVGGTVVVKRKPTVSKEKI